MVCIVHQELISFAQAIEEIVANPMNMDGTRMKALLTATIDARQVQQKEKLYLLPEPWRGCVSFCIKSVIFIG